MSVWYTAPVFNKKSTCIIPIESAMIGRCCEFPTNGYSVFGISCKFHKRKSDKYPNLPTEMFDIEWWMLSSLGVLKLTYIETDFVFIL